MRFRFFPIILSLSFYFFIQNANASSIVFGNEFSVGSNGSWISNFPIHFHSNDSLDFPAETTNLMEIGECCAGLDFEEVRGLAEFNMASTQTATSALLSLEVIELGGLFQQFPPAFSIEVLTYNGNNIEELADYTRPSTSSLGIFNTSGLSEGDIVDLDITDAFNAAIGLTALGIRLQASSEPGGGAIVFGNAAISYSVIPSPAAVWLFGTALLGLVGLSKRRKAA